MIIAWFSAGISSAVACKLALDKYNDVKLIYIQIDQVHPDNARFINDCEKWYGQEILMRRSIKFKSPIDVALKTKYVNGPQGARCTTELKKKVRYEVQKEFPDYNGQIFGFDASKREVSRAERLRENFPETMPIFPLIDNGLTKPNSLAILEKAGIKKPAMYELGYPNNNCIGCLKGGMGYWNLIRKNFPDIFQKTARMERIVGNSCIKGKFLDELKEDGGHKLKPIVAECDLFCQSF